MGSEEAVQSLMEMRSGGSILRSPNTQIQFTRQIGDVVVTHEQVQELFLQYVMIVIED